MLLAVICMLALLTISLSVAIPNITKQIQRDRDVETMHRGQQYIRAIQLYYRKFHNYPPSIDALVNTNNIRFLRKRYVDPITRKDDWKPIYFGQNKAPLAMGFFGQPLGGGMNGATPIAGVGPSGMNGMQGQNGLGFGPPTGGGSSSINPSSTNPGSTDNGATNPSTGNPTDTGTAGNTGLTGGQTFGGAGIVGVEPASPKESILVYKKKTHYNEWEFTYSPLMDLMKQQNANGNAVAPPGSSIMGNGSNPDQTGPTGQPNPNNGGGNNPNPMQPTMPPDQ